MSDFEAFSFNEAGESYDPAAFERFKEKVKKNAKFVAAQRKAEQKQKQKEEVLLKILMRFFQRNQNSGIVLLASRLLEQNIPAVFVLATIVLGNEELQKESQDVLPRLAGPKHAQKEHADKTEFSLISAFRDESIPLKVKIEIDEWGRGLLEAGLTQPYRLLETALGHEGNVKKVVIDCMANVVQTFLEKSGMQNLSYETTFSFCEFLSHGVLKRVKAELEDRKLLEGTPDNP